MNKKVNAVELDTSFDAIAPYVYCIFNFIINNESIPVGLSIGHTMCVCIGPSEKCEIYSNLYDYIKDSPNLSGYFSKLQKIPILTDEGKALCALQNKFSLEQYLCFHHLIKKFGAQSRMADFVKNLLFSSFSESMFREKFNDYRLALCEELRQSSNAVIERFNRLFNSLYDKIK